jgi:hypothetical protein
MLVKTGADMLLETRVALDKVESFRNESFEPEEIQLFLNKSQFRLLDDLINKNFQQGTLRYEWMRPFQAQTAGGSEIDPVWDADSEVPSTVEYPAELYFLVAASAQSIKNGVDAETKWDDGCDQPITDPLNIPFPMNKLVQLDIIETGEAIDRTHNSFYGNNARSPRTEVKTDGLTLYRGENFIISAVAFDYIIEPPLIEVEGVNSTVELPWSVSANQKIIDYTVEYMRLTIADPAYQGNVNDFNIRTQNA